MNNNVKKQIINISFLIPLHMLQIIINFFSKTIFIRTMGQDYFGVNVIFGDIVNFLSLTELGLGGAITFSLYKALSQNDTKKISSIMNYAKNLFNKIFIAIFIIGFSLIPTLKYIINSNLNQKLVIFYYVLYLTTVAVTYLSSYKIILITADEKTYIVKILYTITNVFKAITQILILINLKNFALYLLDGIIFNLIYNFLITLIVNKSYPFISKKDKIDEYEKKNLFVNTKAIFKNKIATLVLNNTDNILISSILTTSLVGKYSSYTTIFITLVGFVENFYYGIVHTVGKENTENTTDKMHKTFNNIHTIMFFITGIICVCFLLLANDFIKLWIGTDYILDNKILIVTVLNLYITIICYPTNIYVDTTKLFIKTQNVMILTAFLNIIISIALGNKYGLFGILVATIISKLVTFFWFNPYLLFKDYFKCNNSEIFNFFKKLIIEFLFFSLITIIEFLFLYNIEVRSWVDFLLKGIVIFFITIMPFLTVLIRNKDFLKILNKILKKRV